MLAGVNGAGKSSLGGAMIRESGGVYFNPDEAARRLREREPRLSQAEANGLAWHQGRRLLERALAEGLDYAFETTLGASTIPALLKKGAESGARVHVWYVGLDSPQRHLARVRSRVKAGGHDIPEADIRRRWDRSRENLVWLMPRLAALKVFDNSVEGDPRRGRSPQLRLLIEMRDGHLVSMAEEIPDWARPLAARALQLQTN